MSTYRAFEATGVHQLRLAERELVDPAPGHVRLRVEACGVCHTDVLAVEGLRADPAQPLVPGHEVVGVIDAVGAGVTAWQPGDRVGVGFLGGQCWECEPCRRGDFVNCLRQQQTGTTVDGGYAEVVYARSSGLVRIPDGLTAAEAAPLLCAGLTTFMALQQDSTRAGSLVAVQGIGGLGHLALQYARSLGHRVVAIARGSEKEKQAREMGAHEYINSTDQDPAAALRDLGGAALIVATAASGASMSPLVGGLAPGGKLVVVGAAPDPITVSTPDLIFGTRTLAGSLTGSSIQNEDNLAFVLAHGIRPAVEVLPFEQAMDGYERMLSGKARFRVVLDVAA
ncbi:alcohol dehydrogenase [Streptomyces sp. NRRL F-5122]|uniref:alcohol dehydrogenase catalytic domain-containing protein n=1 Tax=Streptomyces sp. NRRL F-5122 TaxID=1609098 RepID=UPI0007410131|nr:alcohol dehydrogenase catalytic domain-containing protein [Streptomyces sp. NRRL F-5122]KUJ37810.1 alcohol dehydrogenase [Streptomyces sp. NRRL F-5122]